MDSIPPNRSVQPKTVSVTQLLRRVKLLLEGQIGQIWVEGEVSNLRKQSSGHWYFSLKDEGGQIQCAMFSASRRVGHQVLEDGVKVRAFAETTVYESRGQLQLIVDRVEVAGVGDLLMRFEALKKKLAAEGLFDAERKKPLPEYVQTVGIITSGTGAALQDILNVLTRRAPWVQPVLISVRVQGKGAEVEIAQAIERMGHPEWYGDPICDVMIVGRGGGSIEDLWNFNEEIVARAIAACPIPVISAVGHEIDFTIADFVADHRAPTPSAAAEIAVADGVELVARMDKLKLRLRRVIEQQVDAHQSKLEMYQRGILKQGGERLLRDSLMRLDAMNQRLEMMVKSRMEQLENRMEHLKRGHEMQHPTIVFDRRIAEIGQWRKRIEELKDEQLRKQSSKLEALRGMIRALGPESVFQRGFSITLGPDGKAIRSCEQVKAGDIMVTKLKDGQISSVVQE